MAEVIGIIASAITIGASAAQVSLALFSVVQTLKNAPQQIAEIAEEFSLVSESLQTLADVIRINQDVCRPALFKNTHTIISRYKQVDAEIKKLIDTPSKLAGLQWYLNKPKAKALLKKVEGIKTALILELNIIRLAKEEFTRPYSEIGPSTSVGLPPKFNRFRKVVESAVQANRKVVENAQQDDENAGTKEEQYTNVELDIWKHDSFDTATWLYHLVFSGDIPHPPEANAKTRRLHQASVADVSASSDEDVTIIRPATDTEEKAMIVWNKQTEPSSVVDRLLSSWTTLSSDQITRSAANQDGDEWREGLLKNLEEAKKADEKTFSQWELENEDLKSSEEDNLSGTVTPPYNIHNVIKNRRNRRERSQRSDPWSSKPGESPALNDRKSDRIDYRSSASRQPGVKRHVRWESDESSDEPSFSRRFRRPDYARPPYLDDETTSSRTYPSLSGQTSSTTSIPRPGFPNPFNPNHAPPSAGYGYTPPWQDPLQGTHFPTFDQRPSNPFSNQADAWANWASGFSPHYASVPPPPPPPPPPQPMLVPYPQAPSTYANLPPPRPPEEQPNTTETAAKEKAVMKAVEDLLEKREQNKQLDASEPRFLKLMELFNTQKEHELENERERANAATEAQTKLMQAMHDKDEERLKQLETLVEELREEERHMRINWQVETEKQVKEARDTAAKEIAAVQSAREEAERQAQQRADARIATELRKLKRDHRKELKRYEDQMRELQEQQTKREQDAQLPIRRTRIAEGNRSVDVTEYSTDKRNPFHPSPSHLRGLQYGFAQLGINLKQPQAQHQYPDSFHSSTTSMQSSYTSIGTANTSNPSGSSQQLIVFPAKADRGSKKIAKLQSSLASLGIDAVFEDPEYELASQLVPYNNGDSGDHLVRSTIIWEAPMLSIGSELLLTMRQAGWRPAYTRISEKGHTHFLGNQPIHAYFFSPDYKPQFSQSTDPSTNESVLIHKSLVHEEALMELGFKYEAGDRGNYVLDGWVDYRDIEYLVERSFAINETRWRRIHRKLQGHFNEVADQAPKTTHRSDTQRCEADQPSMPSTPFAYSGDNEFKAFGDSNYDTEGRESSAMSTATRRHHHHRDSDHSDRASTPGRDESSADSGSIISIRSTSSKNPFRQYMSQAGENKHVRGPKFASTTWNDEV